jgi:hypothetical protein
MEADSAHIPAPVPDYTLPAPNKGNTLIPIVKQNDTYTGTDTTLPIRTSLAHCDTLLSFNPKIWQPQPAIFLVRRKVERVHSQYAAIRIQLQAPKNAR